jgi:hypothetical protein
MNEVTIQAGSEEYVRVKVERRDRRAYDPTGDPVEFAFLPRGAAWDEALWGAGVWDTDDAGEHWAMALVGVAPFDLGAGSYAIYTRITDDPEHPKDMVGTLRVK